MSLLSRRISSVYGLSTVVSSQRIPFSTLTNSSPIIVASNPYDLNQFRNENYEYVFIYDYALEDLLAGNVSAGRLISHPIVEYLYNVNNLSSYPTVDSLANGPAAGNLPQPNLPTSANLNKFLCDPTDGILTALKKIIQDGLFYDFQFSGAFCPHIYSSSYTIINPITGAPLGVNRLMYLILDDNNRVLLFGTSISSSIFYNSFIS